MPRYLIDISEEAAAAARSVSRRDGFFGTEDYLSALVEGALVEEEEMLRKTQYFFPELRDQFSAVRTAKPAGREEGAGTNPATALQADPDDDIPF